MNRRDSIRFGVLFAFGLALGKMDTLKASDGLLTCDLNQWRTIRFTYKGKTINVPVADVMRALESGLTP